MAALKRPIAIKTDPRTHPRLPFASETDLQRFLERHATDLLGITLLGSTTRGGGRLFAVDIIAVTASGQLVLLECKHDNVGLGAFKQLERYKSKVWDRWSAVEARTRRRGLPLKKTAPLLVAVGYRCSVPPPRSVLCLSYSYVDVAEDKMRTGKQTRGRVRLQVATIGRGRPHPRVNKGPSFEKRLRDLPISLQKAFRRIQRTLCERAGLTAPAARTS